MTRVDQSVLKLSETSPMPFSIDLRAEPLMED